jgi:hypothetical protein
MHPWSGQEITRLVLEMFAMYPISVLLFEIEKRVGLGDPYIGNTSIPFKTQVTTMPENDLVLAFFGFRGRLLAMDHG